MLVQPGFMAHRSFKMIFFIEQKILLKIVILLTIQLS